MKKLLIAMAALTLLFSCKKSDAPQHAVENNVNWHRTGLMPDDPNKVAAVPLYASQTYLHLARVAQLNMSDLIAAKHHGKPFPQPQPAPDTTAPIVAISSPAQGAQVSGTVTVAASAYDNVGVSSLSFYVNGAFQQSANATSYNFSWSSDAYAGTSPQLSVTARDAAGNTSTYSVTVVVGTPPPPPPPVVIPSTFPSSFRLQTPPVGNQGYEGSCVAWSETYAARSIEEYYRSGASSYDFVSNIFSPEYTYDYAKFSDCGSGTGMQTVLDVMKSKGSCLWSVLPYSDVNGCDASIASPFDSYAAPYTIKGYSKLLKDDSVGIKTMLLAHHPVMISIAVDNAFMNAGAGYIWNTNGTGGAAGHSVAIIGWDDAKHAYLIQNSWTTGWGDQGFLYIDYNFWLTKSGTYVYVMNY